MADYWVYILTGRGNRVMYVGVTSDLARRVQEHKHKAIPGFTQKYNVGRLVYFEQTPSVEAAITREKQIKGWRREKKGCPGFSGQSRMAGFDGRLGRVKKPLSFALFCHPERSEGSQSQRSLLPAVVGMTRESGGRRDDKGGGGRSG